MLLSLKRPFWFDHRSDLSPGVLINPIDPKALFRLSVLGPLISRERLERGELQQILRELASREYAIPGSRRRHLSEKTIQA